MPICVVVLKESETASQLSKKLREAAIPLVSCQLVQPLSNNKIVFPRKTEKTSIEVKQNPNLLEPIEIDAVKLLNPKLSKQLRQRGMALWLMPFGFLAGLTFSQMTDLQTFANLGFGPLGESLIGGLLGMGSGWIGSQAAAASVNPGNDDDIASLRKRSEEGLWLLLLKTPMEIDVPWRLVQGVEPVEVVRLNDL